MRALLFIFCLFGFAVVFSAGRYRDDVPRRDYIKLAKQPQFDCVGAVLFEGDQEFSCVLITDTYVLTAAHCFMEASEFRKDTFRLKDGAVFIGNVPTNEAPGDIGNYTFVFNGKKYKGKRYVIHPAFLDSASLDECDLAIVELEKPVKGIKPAVIGQTFDELFANVIGVGFGTTAKASHMQNVGENLPSIKLAGENVIDSILGFRYNGLHTTFLCDFDHPSNPSCNKTGSPVPRPLEYVCDGGDSGGGLFRQQNGQWQLIGICEGSGVLDITQMQKTGYYGSTMRWTRVSPFAGWIKETAGL